MPKKTQNIDEWIHQRSSSFRWSSWLVYNEQVLHPALSEELAVADEDAASVEKKKKEKKLFRSTNMVIAKELSYGMPVKLAGWFTPFQHGHLPLSRSQIVA
jgi:hypothetical protein